MQKKRIFVSFLVVVALALCSIFLVGMAKEPEFNPTPIPREDYTGNAADYPDSADRLVEELRLGVEEFTTIVANAP